MIQTNGQQQAAIYARVSTTDQADKGYSLPQQIDSCLAMAQQGGYTVPESHILADDYTGVSLHRPQLTKLRTLVQHQLIHAVFVYDLDRLSRKLAHQLMLCEEMDTCGVALHVVAMPHNDCSPEAQLFSNIRGSFHEYERTRILKRTRDGLVGRSKAGFPPGGTVPLGYIYVRHVDKGGHYEVNPEEATIVTRIFRLYVTEGWSLKAIAAQLSAEHIPTRADRSHTQAKRKYGAGTWYENTVSRILGNTAYIGTLHWGKRQRQPSPTDPDKKTTWRKTSEDTWVGIPVPAIIPRELFDVAQTRKEHNVQYARRNRKHAYLLAGRIRCGICGRRMAGSNSAGYLGYRCSRNAFQDGSTPHTKRSVQARAIEPAVWQAVLRVLQEPTVVAREVERRQADTSAGQDAIDRERLAYQRQLAQCEKELRKWEDAYLQDALSVQDLKTKKAEIAVRRASAEHELARLDAQEEALEQITIEMGALTDYCKRVHARLRTFNVEEQTQALKALDIHIIWHPEKPPEITGAIPVELPDTAHVFTYHASRCTFE